MRKLLITAAVLAASFAASGAGAGTAGASTATQLCVAGQNTCYVYGSKTPYPKLLTVNVQDGYTIAATLTVAGSAWTSAISATDGLYTVKSEAGIQVSDITLGTPAGNPAHYTCLSFKVNATVTVYLDDPVPGFNVWHYDPVSCGSELKPTSRSP
jgi:hypothetical protein